MGYRLNISDTNNLLNKLKKEYKIYGPKKIVDNSEGYEEEVIGYGEIQCLEDIIYKEKSIYPIKDVVETITKTLHYKNIDSFYNSLNNEEEVLIFARPCDINAQLRQDNIYLKNGFYKDELYKKAREKIRFICIECVDGFENCFCTTMGSNKTDKYSLAIRFGDDFNLFNVNDESFEEYFKGFKEKKFEPKFIENNKSVVSKLKIDNQEILEKIRNHPMWDEYNKRCIDCGRCNMVCNGSSSFASIELNLDGNTFGSTRKIQIFTSGEGFDSMVGSYSHRKTPSEKIKNRVLYKLYEYKEKFGEELCVGCGRCIDRCPERISIVTTINKIVEIINI